jgi:hypothetical protein
MRVMLDFIGVTPSDGVGIHAIIKLADAVYNFGGCATVGEELHGVPGFPIDILNGWVSR